MTTSTGTLSIPHLRAEFDDRVIGPDSPEYDRARQVVRGDVDKRPSVINRPVDAAEVARVVSLASETGAELAVRSGGHSAVGHSVSDGGTVLDLANLRALDIDIDARTAWAETGLTAGAYTQATGAHDAVRGDLPAGAGGLPAEAAQHESWVNDLTAALREGEDGAYVGFLSSDDEPDVRRAYPEATWDRLAAIKRRHDPGNLFRLNHNIPPAAHES